MFEAAAGAGGERPQQTQAAGAARGGANARRRTPGRRRLAVPGLCVGAALTARPGERLPGDWQSLAKAGRFPVTAYTQPRLRTHAPARVPGAPSCDTQGAITGCVDLTRCRMPDAPAATGRGPHPLDDRRCSLRLPSCRAFRAPAAARGRPLSLATQGLTRTYLEPDRTSDAAPYPLTTCPSAPTPIRM